MVYLRLLKYPGAKFVVIPDIRKVFNASHCNLFIDVFGGSGSVDGIRDGILLTFPIIVL